MSFTQVSQLHVCQHIEAALLDVVDEGDQSHTAPGVGHHQQHLRPPELHVIFTNVQHQQVLTHLETQTRIWFIGLLAVCVCVCERL